VLARIPGIAGRAILELGAGNGYFPALLLRRFSGQQARRLVISDQSQALLAIASTELRVDGAEYLQLDVQTPFPFADGAFDLILAGMLFNELPTSALQAALAECARVLTPAGQLIAAVPHPDFVRAVGKKGALTDFGRGLAAMPGAEGLRLPVSRRPREAYITLLEAADFAVEAADVLGTDQVRHAHPGLKLGPQVPLALLLDCQRGGT
jgi:SAM-dependent methyltransferase